MTLARGYETYDVTSAARTLISQDRTPAEKYRQENIISVYVHPDFDLDGGTLSVQVSVQDHETVNVATDAHWHTIEGMTDLQAGTMYTLAVRAPYVALLASNVGAVTQGIVYVG